MVFQLGRGEHGYLVQIQGGEDVGLEICVQGHVGYALDEGAGPVDTDLGGVC